MIKFVPSGMVSLIKWAEPLKCDSNYEGDLVRINEDSFKYLGQMKGSKRDGKGILVENRGSYFEGIFKDGIFVYGIWVLKLNAPNYEISLGHFKDDELVKGWKETNVYACEGTFFNGIPHGGQIHYHWFKEEGSPTWREEIWEYVFFGIMLNGKFGDFGAKKTFNSSAEIYVGQFYNEKYHGNGILKNFHKGITYEGIFENGYLEGEGIIEGPDYKYEGEISWTKENGKGKKYLLGSRLGAI